MAPRWDEVSSSEQYQALTDDEKQRVKERFWTNVVSASSDYQDLSADDQERVRNRFFGPEVRIASQPSPTPKISNEKPSATFTDKMSFFDAVKRGEVSPGQVVAINGVRVRAVPRAVPRIIPPEYAGKIPAAPALGFSPIDPNLQDIPETLQDARQRAAAARIGGIKENPQALPAPAGTSEADILTAAERTGDVPYVRIAANALKDVLVTKPKEGAKVLRDAAVDLISPDVGDIEQAAAATGKVPYGKIAGRTAAEVAAEMVPLTPTEIATTALTPAVVRGAGAGARAVGEALFLDEQMARAANALRRLGNIKIRIPFVGRPAADAAAEAGGSAAGAAQGTVSAAKPPIAGTPAQPAAGTEAARVRLPGTGAPSALPPVGPEDISRAQALVARTEPAPTKDYFGQQLAKFNVSNDAKVIFDETSNAFRQTIDQARRGKIDWEGTKQLADQLGMSEEELLKRRAGKAFNAEEFEAAKALTGESLERVSAAQKAYAANPGDETLANLAGEMARHSRVQASFMGARAEAGRALQILRKVTDPATMAKRNFQGMLDALGGRKMTEEAAKALAAIDPTDTAAVNSFIRQWTRAKTTDKLYEFWLNSILSSPLTHKANVVGNTIFTLARLPEKVARGVIDAGIGAFTGKRTAYASEVAPEAYGIIRGITDGLRRGLYAFRTGMTEESASKLELGRIPAIKGQIGDIIRIPGRALVAEDEFAKAINYRMELSALALRKAKQEGMKGAALAKRVAELEATPTDEMISAIGKDQLYRTFQDPAGPWMQDLMLMRNKVPGLRYVIPFLQTPMNVAKRALERSPLGWIKVLHSAATKKGQAVVASDAANAVVGSAIAGAVAYYAAQGRITGEPPNNPAERDQFFRSGKLPYAIKVGDKWYSYARIEPLSMIMGATAQAVQIAKESGKEPDPNVVGSILSSLPKYLVSQTFLTGVRDMLNALDDPQRYGDRWVMRNAGSAVPFSGFTRFIAQQLDNTIRQPDTIKESIMANIPGLSKRVPIRYDAYGQPSRRPNDLFSTLVVPRSTERVSPLDVEDTQLDRVQGFAGRSMGGIPLAPKEYREVNKVSGRLIKLGREAAQRLPGWKNVPADVKVQIVNQLQQAARDEAHKRVFKIVLQRLPGGDARKKFIEYGLKRLRIVPALNK